MRWAAVTLVTSASWVKANWKIKGNRKSIFQLNCESLNDVNSFIKASLSSLYVGLYASINYDKLVINKPYDLVPNYVSPFVVNTKK